MSLCASPSAPESTLATRAKHKALAAAIDIGSHETIMRVAELRLNKPPHLLETVYRTLPLGSDTYGSGRISQALVDQLIKILQSFQQKLKEYGEVLLEVTATSAVREAANMAFIVEQIRQRTGIAVRVLSNSMETALHFMGLAASVEHYADKIQETTLIVDIRAGSLQLSMYDQGQLVNSMNFHIGALRVKELLSDVERHVLDYSALLTEYIGGDLRYYAQFGPKRTLYKHVFVIGSSARFMRHLLAHDDDAAAVSASAFHAMYERLLAVDSVSDDDFTDIPSEHRSLVLPTAIIIDEVLRFTGADVFFMPDVSLSFCVLTELSVNKFKQTLAYHSPEDLVSSARHVMRRYRVDKKHSFHVETLALKLFDLTVKWHGLKKQDRLCLQLAAILHNVGKYIAVSDEGAYTFSIIQATEFIGLSKERELLVALLARFHNGNVHIGDYYVRLLPEAMRIVLMKLIALLAYANSLDAGHMQKIELIRAKETERGLQITYTAHADTTLERFHTAKRAAFFQDVFGLAPYLVQRPLPEEAP